MNTDQILQQQTTKTRKIEMLLEGGMTRKEVATLMGVGYGFVQNVYAKMYPERIRARGIQAERADFEFSFNRTFGVEIELFGIERDRLVRELQAAGLEAASEGYNHTTRRHWKIVNDGSIVGPNALELVSPVLRGEAGMEELRKACAVLKRLGGRVNKTTGLHYGKQVVMLSTPPRGFQGQALHSGGLSIISVVTRRSNSAAAWPTTYEKERKSNRNHTVDCGHHGGSLPFRI